MPLPRRKSRLSARALGTAAVLTLAAVTVPVAWTDVGWAQNTSHATVVRVLSGSRDFRARVRAALALGSSNDPAVTPHLVRALSDENSAVRAAAATSLGRVGDPSALGALRGLSSDRERVVRNEARRAIQRIEVANRASTPAPTRRGVLPRAPGSGRYPTIAVIPQARDIHWPGVRYVVVLGTMENRSNFREGELDQMLEREVSRGLTVLRGVAVLHEGREPADAEREIRRRRLPKIRLEGSLNRVERRAERRDLSVRCEVSLMLLEEPGRSIRSVLNGAATGRAPRSGQRADQERRLAQQALEGAVRGAMSGAAVAISSAGGR